MRPSLLRAVAFSPTLLVLGGSTTQYVAKVRRKWEGQLMNVLAEQNSSKAQRTVERFDKIYSKHDFTPVDRAFPLLDESRWADLETEIAANKSKGEEIETQPPSSRVVKVAIIGPPNAGKSSLVNSLVTSHVSAASRREGTTTDWVKGVSTIHSTQLVFLDTPGIFPPANKKVHLRQVYASCTYAAWDSLYSRDGGAGCLACGQRVRREGTQDYPGGSG